MTFQSTPGHASANSYVSVEEADEYFNVSYSETTWGDLELLVKENLLVQSTRLLDTLYLWSGFIDSSSTQSLRWPRIGVIDIDRRSISGSVIPNQIKYATCELAISIYRSGGYKSEENTLDSMKVGPISMTFSDTVRAPTIPKIVKDLIQNLGNLISSGSTGIHTVKLER